MKTFVIFFCLIILSVGVAAQSSIADVLARYRDTPTQRGNRVTTFLDLVSQHQDIQSLLSSTNNGQMTVFAPSDTAFRNSLKNNQDVTSKRDLMSNILNYHIIPGRKYVPGSKRDALTTALKATGPGANMLGKNSAGQKLIVDFNDQEISVRFGLGRGKVIETIDSQNVVIYIIDTMLVPPRPVSTTLLLASFSEMAAAIQYARSIDGIVLEQINSMTNITFFVPSNKLFQEAKMKLQPEQVAAVIANHIFPGVSFSTNLNRLHNQALTATNLLGEKFTFKVGNDRPIQMKGSNMPANNLINVVDADILTDNGVIHEIDKLIIPDFNALSKKYSLNSSTATANHYSFGTLAQHAMMIGFTYLFLFF